MIFATFPLSPFRPSHDFFTISSRFLHDSFAFPSRYLVHHGSRGGSDPELPRALSRLACAVTAGTGGISCIEKERVAVLLCAVGFFPQIPSTAVHSSPLESPYHCLPSVSVNGRHSIIRGALRTPAVEGVPVCASFMSKTKLRVRRAGCAAIRTAKTSSAPHS